MFHRHQTAPFDVAHAPFSTGGRWYVTDEEYHEAIRRGMQMRSEVFADIVRAIGRAIARAFKG